jgi:hypothetical protein
VYGEWQVYEEGAWGECEQGVKTRTVKYVRYGKQVCPVGVNCEDPCPPEYKEEKETDECEPTATGYCHVSNKGSDDDINIVVSYKRAGEGHEKHLDPKKYCPIDYVIYDFVPTFTTAGKPKPKEECKVEGGDEDKCSCTYPAYMPYAPEWEGLDMIKAVKEFCLDD